MTTYREGKSYIKNGDCLQLMKEVQTGSVDMILCDLPYGTTRNKWDVKIDMVALWAEYERIIKDHGAIVLFAQVPFNIALGASNRRLLRYEWVWVKEQGTGFLNAKRAPLKIHENILVFYKHLPTYCPQFTQGKPYETKRKGNNGSNYGKGKGCVTKSTGTRYPVDVLHFVRDTPRLHPTQKPVKLCEYLIKTYTNEGDTVLDNCMGSGTSCVAAANLGRHYIGMELEREYYEIAKNRLKEAAAKREETWESCK